MRFTYYGHSCFAVEVAGKRLLFDPFISPNPKAAHINLADIKADYILISHGHEDHIADIDTLAKSTGAKVISNFEIIYWLGNHGVEGGHYMNHGGSIKYDWGTVKYTYAFHSSTLPDGSYGGNPGGFVVSTPEGSFFYSGDTALSYDFKLIGEKFNLDFCVLPIGDNFTMGAEDASTCAKFVNCTKVVGVHYNTFPAIVIDIEEAKNTFTTNGQQLILPLIGETIEI